MSTFDFPVTPPLELLHPPSTALPTNPELVLGENDRAFVSYGRHVGGFLVSSGGGGWSYPAANEITMLAATSDESLVAKTLGIDGADTILQFPAGGGVGIVPTGVVNVDHVVGDLWTHSDPAPAWPSWRGLRFNAPRPGGPNLGPADSGERAACTEMRQDGPDISVRPSK